MKYHEMTLTISFESDIHFTKVNEKLAQFIAKAMLFDEDLKIFHKQNTFKQYCFSQPLPNEQDGIYVAGRIYFFNIRTVNLKFALMLKQYLTQVNGAGIKVISIDIKTQTYRSIDELRCATPAVATLNKRYWVKEDGIETISDRIQSNLVKKIKSIKPDFQEPPEVFFDCIIQQNKKPIRSYYKTSSLIGNKFILKVKPDSTSQEMAFWAMAMGLLEKGSIGFGFCKAK